MKTLQTVLLIVLIVGVIAVTGTLIAVLSGKLKYEMFQVANSVVLSDQRFETNGIDAISVRVSSTDIEFRPSEDDEWRVVYKGPDSETKDPLIKASVESGSITIKQRNQFMPMFFGVSRFVIVYVPNSFSGSVSFHCSSGDLDLTDDFNFSDFEYKVSSGDMTCKTLSASKLSIITTSGDIVCDTVSSPQYFIRTTSGDIDIGALTGDGSVEVTSGRIQIDGYTGSGSLTTSSGDINLGLLEVRGDISIRVTSGNVDVSVPEQIGLRLDLSVTSGDIDTDIVLNDTQVSNNETKGTIGDDPENLLQVKTTSGDIRIFSR